MTTIAVMFPDGSVRQCPAKQITDAGQEALARPAHSVFVPVDDPDWTFHPVLGGWRAN